MSTDMADGWVTSAQAWIDELSSDHEFGRRHVLDAPMLARVDRQTFTTALDIGCGEGRFCRTLAERGIATVGIDPTLPLLDRARALHFDGDYRPGRAEQLEFDDAGFDLVVSYLSLIDIPGFASAISEMARVLRPGGTLLIANLNAFNTATVVGEEIGSRMHGYLRERADWVEWRGIRIRNWHRPLSAYMQALLSAGLELRHFDEPAAAGGPPARVARYNDVPWFHIMEWRKPV